MLKDCIAGPAGDMPSPLKHFTNAKKKINTIFSDIAQYIEDFGEFIEDIGNSKENILIDEELENEILTALEKVNGIKDMISRNHMKVVFFGRTSNGKSTVINAMLWDKILPSGIGHTTNCFLSVAGCDDDKSGSDGGGYLLCGGSEEQRNVKNVNQLGHALSDGSMSNDSLIQIFWPKRKCALLKDEVVLLDSPGIDVSLDLDQWIDNYCLDADVFILVANAESTLMLAEKNFFHRVNKKLSKPNIFILNNRWDASASEPELMEEVRQQHLERGVSFLAEELKVVTKQQAKDRVFFVSAKETLQSRMQRLQGKKEPSSPMADGHQARLMEFTQFEREFEECISQSATRTKFEHHCHRAAKIIENLNTRAQWLQSRSADLMKECDSRMQSLENRLKYIDQQLEVITQQCRSRIAQLAAEAEQQVKAAMSDEIRRLPLLVDEFQRPFQSDRNVLRVFKTELYRHVDEGLGRNLSARCSVALQKDIDRNKGEMVESIRPLLIASPVPSPDEDAEYPSCVDTSHQTAAQAKPFHRSPVFRSLVRSASLQPSFDMSYGIDCASLCADFQEDIQFKFSLGFIQLMSKFIGPKNARRVRLGGITTDVLGTQQAGPAIQYHPALPADHVGVHGAVEPVIPEDLLWSFASGYLKFTESHSTLVVVCLGMLPWVCWKAVGWKALVFSSVSYCALFAYERLTWTSRAKERALKRQFVEHATEKLNLVISFTSSSCSRQVQQELSATFDHLRSDIDIVKQDIETECADLERVFRHLEAVQTESKTLNNKAGWLASELELFTKKYLDSPPVFIGNDAT